MPDIWESDAGDASAFELPGDAERLAAASDEASEPETPASPEAESQTKEERARDEKGRFAPQESPESEAAAEIVEAEAEGQDPVERLLAKYGGDQRKALEAALEAQRTIGSMERELGPLRDRAALADRLEQYVRQLQSSPQQQAVSQGEWENLLEERPFEAARQAYTHGQQTGDWRYWQTAAQAWDEVNPGASEIWLQQQQLAAGNQQLQQYLQEQVLGQKVAEVADKLGGLDESIVEKMSEILPRFPMLQAVLSDPSMPPEVKAQAVEALELIRRGLDTGTLAEQAQETARKLAQDEQHAVEQAGVVTATRTNPQQPQTTAGRISEEWWEDERRWNEGWNIS